MTPSDHALRDMGMLMGLGALSFDDEGRAALQFDGGYKINILREDANTIELWARVIGFGPVSDPAMLRHALEGNFIGGPTAGARLALEPEARHFSLCERLSVKDMTGAALEAALHSFLAALAFWSSPEALPADRAPNEDEPTATDLAEDSVFIRL